MSVHCRPLRAKIARPLTRGRARTWSHIGRAEHGFTLIEVLVAAFVLVVGGLALVGLVDAANGATTSNKQREAGTNLAREIIENVGTVAYDDVTPASVLAELQGREGLADGSATTGYQIERRDVEFTVDVEVCNLDDASDGLGSHATVDGIEFCSGSGAGGASDDSPDDYRNVTVVANWTHDGETKSVRQSSFVLPPSGSDLPVVTTLTPDPSSPIDETYGGSTVDFTATTSSIPAGVSWSKDGSELGDATGSGTSWNFTWPITGLVDGDYVIGARGRTAAGSYGPVHALTMRLNRYEPTQPQGFVAGKNGASVDAEWLANRERDIEGYTVYRRVNGGADEQVNCGTLASPVFITTSLSCTDAAPAAGTTSVGNISFVSASQAASDGTSALTVNAPTGLVAGNVMIATVATSSADAVNPPTGWTEIENTTSSQAGAAVRFASYYRVVPSGGSEPTTHKWTTPLSRSIAVSITAWSGADTTAPINVSRADKARTAVNSAPTVTTTTANATLIRAFGQRQVSGSTLSAPTGTTVRNSTNYTALHLSGQFSQTQATAGATGAATAACTGSCSEWVAHTIALKPVTTTTLAADYWVKAVDLDRYGNYRWGPASTAVAAYAANTAPTAPTGLTGTAAANGSNVVNWTTQGTDADAGDSVSFYRVYRDGVKFDRTGSGTDTSWTDSKPGSGSHTYLLKAVDTRLAESAASTSVTISQP